MAPNAGYLLKDDVGLEPHELDDFYPAPDMMSAFAESRLSRGELEALDNHQLEQRMSTQIHLKDSDVTLTLTQPVIEPEVDIDALLHSRAEQRIIVRDAFVRECTAIADNWIEQPGLDERMRVVGAIGGLLAMLDGLHPEFPAVRLSTATDKHLDHPDLGEDRLVGVGTRIGNRDLFDQFASVHRNRLALEAASAIVKE